MFLTLVPRRPSAIEHDPRSFPYIIAYYHANMTAGRDSRMIRSQLEAHAGGDAECPARRHCDGIGVRGRGELDGVSDIRQVRAP